MNFPKLSLFSIGTCVASLVVCSSLSASAVTLAPDPTISFWRNAESGSTLNFSVLPAVGGVTGFKAFGQATFNGVSGVVPADALVLQYCGYPGPSGACIAGPVIGAVDPAVPFAQYDGTVLSFRTEFSVLTPNRPNDLIGYVLSFRVDNNGTETIIANFPGSTARSFDASGTYTFPVSPTGSGTFFSAYNWFLEVQFLRTLVDEVDSELGPESYTVIVPSNSIDVSGVGTASAVPEPSTGILIAGALLLLPLARRHSR